MLPILTEWPVSDTTSICALQDYAPDVYVTLLNVVNTWDSSPTSSTAFSDVPYGDVNLPLIFNNVGTGVPNITMGSAASAYVLMPPMTQRSLLLDINLNAAVDFTIVGQDYYGNSISEVIECASDGVYESVLSYSKLISIIGSSDDDGTISVGYGNNGLIMFPILDIYNQNATYNVSYNNVTGSGGDQETTITPLFTTLPVITFQDRVQVLTQFEENKNAYPFADNDSIIYITTGQTLPVLNIEVDSTASFSFQAIPVTSIGCKVINSSVFPTITTGNGFTQTIIQQGGGRR